MIGKVLVFFIVAILGIGAVGIVLLVPLSLAVVGVLAVTLLLSGSGVPLIYSLRALTARKGSTFLTGLGLAMVVFVFATILMLCQGIRMTFVSTGSPDNVKVLRMGSTTEVQSSISAEQVRLLGAAPELAVDAAGRAQLTAESLAVIFLSKEGAVDPEDGANVTVRGIGAQTLQLRDRLRIDGQMVRPGTSELVVGRALVGRFKGLRPGGQINFGRRQWTVVGVLEGQGTAFDSEIWGDAQQLNEALQRRGILSSMTLRLKAPASLAALQARVEANQQLNSLSLMRESDYYAKQSGGMVNFIQFLGMFVTSIFGLAAALGAMITMYMQVGSRTREIGILRALGFRQSAVLVAFIFESVILGLCAGVVGIAAASLMRFASFVTTDFQTFSDVSFHFTLTLNIFGWVLAFSTVLGYCGGLFPAIRASRMSIVDAMRCQ